MEEKSLLLSSSLCIKPHIKSSHHTLKMLPALSVLLLSLLHVVSSAPTAEVETRAPSADLEERTVGGVSFSSRILYLGWL